ncbi:MAG: hypothetical protein L0332_23205 [Chloroflexi bacterium]|nr:hypothetical protein [Chloroflexota bacterium]MCI0580161.1 hypothetical protein [Chloroflexota bacterium]MCI0647450.1 hypothetical protein [Chloroflexota bacterium]MCI0729599.1 hypothetical protein [Chloroflexota bacterium]
MQKLTRILIALAILLSGVALLPFIDWPAEALSWQLFAGVYDATLAVNYANGQPGSYFAFAGSGYPANSEATITVNGDFLGTVTTDSNGNLAFNVNTNNAPPGNYAVTATVNANATATATFELQNGAPLRQLEGEGPIFYVVPTLYLPAIRRSS